MTTTRRHVLVLAGGALAAPALLREGHAQAAQITLRMHHFLPPISNGHAKFLAPWAQKVEPLARSPLLRTAMRRCEGRFSARLRPAAPLPITRTSCWNCWLMSWNFRAGRPRRTLE